jgi:mRNA interferase RelE/StbE
MRVNGLAVNPRPPDGRKLAGHERLWRIRIGRYRVVYEIEDRKLLILVVEVGHRRDIYHRL